MKGKGRYSYNRGRQERESPRRNQSATGGVADLFKDEPELQQYFNKLQKTDLAQPVAQAMFRKKRDDIFRIKPKEYLHVLDQNSNVTRVIEGPTTFICQDHEFVAQGVTKMITIPPRSFVIINNPVKREDMKDPAGVPGKPIIDEHGQAVICHGTQEVRLNTTFKDPFPLYPGEAAEKIMKLQTVYQNKALRLYALQDLVDCEGEKRAAGEEWLFEGPGTYIPHVDIQVLGREKAFVVVENTALKLRAKRDLVDRRKHKRVAGEEWLVTDIGAYLPGAYEEVCNPQKPLIKAVVLTDKKALHLKALKTFKDRFGIERKMGEKWLLTNAQTETYIPSVDEEVIGKPKIQSLTSRQFCVIQDPFNPKTKTNMFGEQRLVRGEKSFFLHPGEKLRDGLQAVHVLQEEQGLILAAIKQFQDDSSGEVIVRKPGERWMIRGPMEYCPPVEVKIVKVTKAIPLDQNEGIYVQNMKTGRIRAVVGETYMLNEEEELWEKEMEPVVEELLFNRSAFSKAPRNEIAKEKDAVVRDKTKVVSYRVPHNTCVQIYDFTKEQGRVVFGPEMVLLEPEEEFTYLSLSGGEPKRPNFFNTLHLLLGPDYFLDEIEVETSDHARLALVLSYNWFFKVNKEDPSHLFAVSDFVGDACKAMASRIRGAVARVKFDDFHKNSAKLIRAAIFGRDGKGEFAFPANNLVITGIDIKSVDPLDKKTKDALQKSVQIAIEITTNAQQQLAEQEAARKRQAASGKLEQQRLTDSAEAERSKSALAQVRAQTAAVKTAGQKKAEAKSRAEAQKIEWTARVDAAKLTAEAKTIEFEAELNAEEETRGMELELMKTKLDMEGTHAEKMAEIEVKKFTDMVSTIGPETIKAMALAGPEMQVKLLEGLGIDSTLIMDGSSPINLFNTAQGLIAGGPAQQL